MRKTNAKAVAGDAAAKAAPTGAGAGIVATVPVTFARVEGAVFALRMRLDEAAQTLAEYEAAIGPIRERFAPRMRRHGAEIAAAKVAVVKVVAAGMHLFNKPKSRVVHGIKIGLRKAADVWAWPKDAALVDLIKTGCTPEQQAAYLVTTTVGKKDAIPVPERERLGIGCTKGADEVVVDEQATGTGAALVDLLAQLPPEAPDGPN